MDGEGLLLGPLSRLDCNLCLWKEKSRKAREEERKACLYVFLAYARFLVDWSLSLPGSISLFAFFRFEGMNWIVKLLHTWPWIDR